MDCWRWRERLLKVEQCSKTFQLGIVSALTSVSFFSDEVSFRSALPDLHARSATRTYFCVRFHRGLRNRCHDVRKSISTSPDIRAGGRYGVAGNLIQRIPTAETFGNTN